MEEHCSKYDENEIIQLDSLSIKSEDFENNISLVKHYKDWLFFRLVKLDKLNYVKTDTNLIDREKQKMDKLLKHFEDSYKKNEEKVSNTNNQERNFIILTLKDGDVYEIKATVDKKAILDISPGITAKIECLGKASITSVKNNIHYKYQPNDNESLITADSNKFTINEVDYITKFDIEGEIKVKFNISKENLDIQVRGDCILTDTMKNEKTIIMKNANLKVESIEDSNAIKFTDQYINDLRASFIVLNRDNILVNEEYCPYNIDNYEEQRKSDAQKVKDLMYDCFKKEFSILKYFDLLLFTSDIKKQFIEKPNDFCFSYLNKTIDLLNLIIDMPNINESRSKIYNLFQQLISIYEAYYKNYQVFMNNVNFKRFTHSEFFLFIRLYEEYLKTDELFKNFLDKYQLNTDTISFTKIYLNIVCSRKSCSSCKPIMYMIRELFRMRIKEYFKISEPDRLFNINFIYNSNKETEISEKSHSKNSNNQDVFEKIYFYINYLLTNIDNNNENLSEVSRNIVSEYRQNSKGLNQVYNTEFQIYSKQFRNERIV